MTYIILQSDKVDTNCFRCNPIRTLKCFWKLITVNFTILLFARKPIQLSRKQVRYFGWSDSNNTQLNIQELVYTSHENTIYIEIKLCFNLNYICHTYNRCQLIDGNLFHENSIFSIEYVSFYYEEVNVTKIIIYCKIFNCEAFEILSIASEWCNF